VAWRDEPGFLYTWLALIALLVLGALGVDPILRDLYYVSIILYVPPVIATLACLSGPLRGSPVAAFLLGFLTYSTLLRLPPLLLSCLFRRCGSLSWPYVSLALALGLLWGLGCALLASSRRPWDLKALPAYPILFLTWRYGMTLLMD